jgi:hypothetical protein
MAIGEDPHGKIKIDVDDQHRIARIEREIRQTSVRFFSYVWFQDKRAKSFLPSPEQAMTTGNEVWSRVRQVDGEKTTEDVLWFSRPRDPANPEPGPDSTRPLQSELEVFSKKRARLITTPLCLFSTSSSPSMSMTMVILVPREHCHCRLQRPSRSPSLPSSPKSSS